MFRRGQVVKLFKVVFLDCLNALLVKFQICCIIPEVYVISSFELPECALAFRY